MARLLSLSRHQGEGILPPPNYSKVREEAGFHNPIPMVSTLWIDQTLKAKLCDDTGEIALNLWRQQIEVVKEGEVVILQNAFAREFSGVVELNIGADGKILPYRRGGEK